MKKKLFFLFGILFMCQTYSSWSQCENSFASITVDQTVENDWSTTPAIAVTLPLVSTTTPTGFSANWRSLYNATNLFFLIEVTKSGALYNQNGANWWEDDAVEIYIDGDNSGGTSYDGINDFQFGFRYNDGTAIKTGPNNPANSTSGIVYSFYTTASGYNVEIGIPWATLNVSPTSGNDVGIELAVDVSNGTRLSQMLTYNNNGQSFNNPSLFGTITLANCPGVTGLLTHSTKNITQIFPNPFHQIARIQLPESSNYDLRIINTQGKIVEAFTFHNSDELQINGEHLNAGLYHYQITDNKSSEIYTGNFTISK